MANETKGDRWGREVIGGRRVRGTEGGARGAGGAKR